jgi:hypothetical protein
MSRLFGWDLPPGVSLKDIEDQAGDGLDLRCIFCGNQLVREEGDDGCLLVEPCGCKESRKIKSDDDIPEALERPGKSESEKPELEKPEKCLDKTKHRSILKIPATQRKS